MEKPAMETYELTVNGITYPVSAPVDRNLVTALRENVGLTGTKEGCDDCECGACMVLVDGQPVNSCSYLAVQAQGRWSGLIRVPPKADFRRDPRRGRVQRKAKPGLVDQPCRRFIVGEADRLVLARGVFRAHRSLRMIESRRS